MRLTSREIFSGNMSLALGPLGRNGEAIGSLNTSGKVAAM
jgi:lipid-binding SYLF domain-containing protein